METGTFLTGFRLPEPMFTFGRSNSSSTSTIMSEGPADMNGQLGYQRATKAIVPWILSDGELDPRRRSFTEELLHGTERFRGISSMLSVKVPKYGDLKRTNLLNLKDPKKLDESMSNSEGQSIAFALLNDEGWRSRLKATCDYRGLPTQTVSKILRNAEPRKGDQVALRQHQNRMKNVAIETYAKCLGIPWTLAKQLEKKYFVGIAWISIRDYYVFAFVPFDSRGVPIYGKAVMRLFQRSAKDFRGCNQAVIQEGLGQIDLGSSRVVLHYHGDLFGLEDVFVKALNEYCKDWVVLSVARPKYPFFRLYSQSTNDALNEKGICVPLDNRRFVVSTTGLPHFNVRGTPQNLFCESLSEMDSNEMLTAATEIYHLAQMDWANIRGYNKLPVTTMLTSKIATGIRDEHLSRQQLGLPTFQTVEAKPWSFW